MSDAAGGNRDLRHNLVALGVDYGLFMVGLTFASTATILPAFAIHLGAPSVVIGAIPAVMTLGWLLPGLFVAGHTETLARKLPFVLRWTAWERIPFALLAAAAFFLADRAPAATLAALLGLLLVITGTGGVLMPAWMSVVGAAVPEHLRGRFFGLSSVFSSALGFAGSFVTAWILATVPAPSSFGWCFLCAAVCMAGSWIALAFVREPATRSTAEPVPLGAYLARMPELLRRDRNLAAFLVARALATIAAMSTAFFTVYALRVWEAPPAQAGVFTGIYLAGQMVGTLALGWVADHAGHRVVFITGVAAMLAANVLALTAPGLRVFGGVFALYGLQIAAVNISNLNILLEFAPNPDARPTYIGLGTTAMAPVALGAPLAAGLLVDAAGFRAVFGLATTAGVASLAVLVASVHDPRRARLFAEPGT